MNYKRGGNGEQIVLTAPSAGGVQQVKHEQLSAVSGFFAVNPRLRNLSPVGYTKKEGPHRCGPPGPTESALANPPVRLPRADWQRDRPSERLSARRVSRRSDRREPTARGGRDRRCSPSRRRPDGVLRPCPTSG